MNDQFNENQPQQPMNPAENAAPTPAAPTRHRRADRNRDAAAPVAPQPTTQMPPVVPPAPTMKHTVVDDASAARPQGEQPNVPRFQTRYNPTTPSQGVPRPGAFQVNPATIRQPEFPQADNAPRRPVQMEGYNPIQPLNANRSAMPQEQPVAMRPRRPDVDHLQRYVTESAITEDDDLLEQDPSGDDEHKGGRGLVVAIVALLALAVCIVGLLLIPDDDTGFLGSIKQTVTAPLRALLPGSDPADLTTPAEASGFTGTCMTTEAPYEFIFTLTTTSNVTDVRIVDSLQNVLPTTTILSHNTGEDSLIWQFKLVLTTEYEGKVTAQIQSGDTWLDTRHSFVINTKVNSAPTLSRQPQNTNDMAAGFPAVSDSQLTADSSKEPTVSPAITEISTDAPTDVPTQTPTELPTDEPTEVPTEVPTDEPTPTPTAEPEAEATEVPTPTPTLSITATPTMKVTATPTVSVEAQVTPSEVPTEEPTATPTAEPTPTPTPVVTPKLEAQAVEDADPALISTQKIYKGTKRVDEYTREKPINMPAGDDYLPMPYGVTTFRGNAFRQNAAVGTVTAPTSLSQLWTVEAGSLAAKSRTFYGFSWPNQPVIMNWMKEIRLAMNLTDEAKAQRAMKEVILTGQDGKIYFLNLTDGTATREAIDFGYPLRGTPSLHPLNSPLMVFGQYGRFLKNKSGDIGLYYYSLVNQKELRMIDGLDGKTDRPYNNVGAFDTSALFDQNTNTLIAVGTNGMLYTETLDMSIYRNADGSMGEFEFKTPTQVALTSYAKGQKGEDAAVESSLAMYGSYAFYADLDGVLRCVDTTTMTTVWAVDTGNAVKAAIALDLDPETNSLWLYTANVLTSKKGTVTIRCYNALTGEEDWSLPIKSQRGSKKDSYGNEAVPGAMASPVIGQKGLNELVYFTLSSLTAEGAEAIGAGDEALPGVLVALDKVTGDPVWSKPLDTYCYSSPVAVYAEDGQGWIIQACANGAIYLLDGLTGAEIATLQVNGTIEASPAVYGDTMVIGTTGKGTSYIYGIKLK